MNICFFFFPTGFFEREKQGNDMPGHLSLAVFLVSVRQPAAFMEMDGAEGAPVAAVPPPPQNKTPTSGE